MIDLLLFLFIFCDVTDGLHFNGGTIRWEPINSTINASVVPINIIQTYSWTYPLISCANDVPITTSGRSSQNANLTCVTDCSTDGGYSSKPVNILTDCQTASSSLGMMTSQRSVSINLTAGAHFYLGYVGSAWVALNDPAKSGLQWSIVSFIDLRMRPDGFINTPPVASIVSPQYAIVNQTTQISIPVSDVNVGDDVRCRWSTYTPGYRRRKRSDEEDYVNYNSKPQIDNKVVGNKVVTDLRKKRWSYDPCYNCHSICYGGCLCSCSGCTGTTCSGLKCSSWYVCPTGTTTVETPATLKPTSSYPNRQPIDECGGICYPNSLPNGTTLSGCTISFTGLVPNTWYGVAVQVEDFIDSTSNISMSSVPVQFLIYVMPQPACGLAPIILPPDLCSDVQVGVPTSFGVAAMTLCDSNVSAVDTILITNSISGMNVTNTINSVTNASIAYVIFTWVPQINQIGSQQLCFVAFTQEQVQSQPYCVTFNVTSSPVLCTITTTTSTTTTSETSTTQTPTTTTATTTTATTTTKAKVSGPSINWLLIVGLSLLALLLALCCCCCCLYWLLWLPAARRRRRRKTIEEPQRDTIFQKIVPNTFRKNHRLVQILGIQDSEEKYSTYTPLNTNNNVKQTSLSYIPVNLSNSNPRNSNFSVINSERNLILSKSSAKQDKPITITEVNDNEKPAKLRNTSIKPPIQNEASPPSTTDFARTNKSEKLNETNDKLKTRIEDGTRPSLTSTRRTNRANVIKIPREKTDRKRTLSVGNTNVINLEKSSINIPSIKNRFQSTSLTRNRKKSIKSNVTVIKLRKTSTANQSHH